MSELTIDRLTLEIESESKNVDASLAALEKTLEKLKNTVKGGIGLKAVINQISELKTTSKGINSNLGNALVSLSKGIRSLKGLENVKLPVDLSKQLVNISSTLRGFGNLDFGNVVSVRQKIDTLSGLRIKGARSFRKDLGEMYNSTEILRAMQIDGAATKIFQLSSALGDLSINGKGTSRVANAFPKISKGIEQLKTVDLTGIEGKVKRLVRALDSTSKVKDNGFSKIVNSISKLDKAINNLNNLNDNVFRNKIQNMTDILEPLSKNLRVATQNVNRFGNSSFARNNALVGGIKVGVIIAGIRRLSNALSDAIGKSNEYIEDLNLFTAAIGEYADKAKRYADIVSETLGIDPAEWLRNQGVFMTLATGFGIAADKASVMSQQLTQLGYDISSFFNISYSDAMLKLQSGLAGELEPLRRIGYDLSKTKLEAIALSLGIDKAFNSMTQAEKAQLRYYAIMTQVTVAQGDMARTLIAPSNQLRILQSQLTMTARAIGNIFIPALNSILPYIIAGLKALRMLVDGIANLVGFKLPEIDYSSLKPQVIQDLSDDVGDVADGWDKAANSAEKYKNTVMGFDELHLLNDMSENSGSGKKAGLGVGNVGGFDVPLPTYDFLGDAVSKKSDAIFEKFKRNLSWVGDKLLDIEDYVKAIGLGFLAWKLSPTIFTLLGSNKLKDWFANRKQTIGLSLLVGSVSLSISNGIKIANEGLTIENLFRVVGASLAGGLGGMLLIGGGTGFTIGVGLTLAATAISWAVSRRVKMRNEELKKRFGNIDLTKDDAQEWARNITLTMAVSNAELYIKEKQTLVELKGNLDSVIEQLNHDNLRFQLGLEVNGEQYMHSINEFLNFSSSYLEQNHLTAKILFKDEFGNTESGKSLNKFLDDTFVSNQNKLKELGEKLKTTISDGFVNGEWIKDKQAEAMRLQSEINEILDRQSLLEFKAKIGTIQMKYADSLTPESFELMNKELEEAYAQRSEELELKMQGRMVLAYDKLDQDIKNGVMDAQAQFDTLQAQINESFRDEKMELSVDSVNWRLDAIKHAYEPAYKAVIETITTYSNQQFYDEFEINPSIGQEKWVQYVNAMRGDIRNAIETSGIGEEGQAAIEYLLRNMEGSLRENHNLYDAAVETGKAIPKGLGESIKSEQMLKAIAGDIDAMGFITSNNLANSTGLAGVTSTLKDIGKNYPKEMSDGFYLGLPDIESAINNGYIKIQNGFVRLGNGAKIDAENAGKKTFVGFKQGVATDFSSQNLQNVFSPIVSVVESVWNSMQPKLNHTADLRINTTLNRTIVDDYIARHGTSGLTHNNPYVKQYASGGFPSVGEVFIARESGPEIVGTIGGKPAVANDSQIVSAVSQGVAQAVSSVMGENQGDVVVIVKNNNDTNGREIYRQKLSKARREGVRA